MEVENQSAIDELYEKVWYHCHEVERECKSKIPESRMYFSELHIQNKNEMR